MLSRRERLKRLENLKRHGKMSYKYSIEQLGWIELKCKQVALTHGRIIHEEVLTGKSALNGVQIELKLHCCWESLQDGLDDRIKGD